MFLINEICFVLVKYVRLELTYLNIFYNDHSLTDGVGYSSLEPCTYWIFEVEYKQDRWSRL